MGKSKEELYEIINAAKEELAVIETKEYIEKNKSYVGKCYKLPDMYSCPETDDDRWWTYLKVTGLTEEGDLNMLIFYKDSQGYFRIEPNQSYYHLEFHPEIDPSEFEMAWIKLLKEINTILF
jgi:hypothetical protein